MVNSALTVAVFPRGFWLCFDKRFYSFDIRGFISSYVAFYLEYKAANIFVAR
ncbi:Hypothetical protein ETEE_2716 [Edwardsiella anguillarum ET080813]|uniref:Uncharacterized protein n=1 Tax=Edwardsiella anguillarum ET080813 TaxID=667120 RepID=A0A076LU98_9GAMM|nr:Hypothetical protein ETEE_2716 [Edwardsiella anguillarum ET080813]